MRKVISIIIVLILISPRNICFALDMVKPDKTILYVSPNGNDLNSGTIDSPLSTIEKARDTLRAMKQEGVLGKDGAVVYLREGTYGISNTISFTEEDSGTKEAPITYRAYEDEKVSFVGGIIIPFTKFKKCTDSEVLNQIIDTEARSKVVELDLRAIGYEGDLPHLADMTRENEYVPEKDWIQPIKIYVGDKMIDIARYPNGTDTMKMKTLVKMCQDTDYWLERKSSSPKFIPKEQRNPTDPLIFIPSDDRYLKWPDDSGEGFLKGNWGVAWYQNNATFTIDKEKGTISTKYPLLYIESLEPDTTAYWAMNMLCELDNEYEMWVSPQGKLYCILPQSAQSEQIFFATATDTMIRIESNCNYLTMRGINFGKSGGRSVETLAGSSNNLFYNCTNSSNGGMLFDGTNNGMKNSTTTTGNIVVTGGDVEKLISAGNYIENCDMSSNSLTEAVTIRGGVGNRVSYCDIHDTEAILAGVYGIKHIFEFNDVHDGVKNSADAGAIYGTLMSKGGVCDRGNIFRYNYIHKINTSSSIDSGISGIYLDDCSSGGLIVGNIFENINNGSGRGIHLGGSNDTIIDNNIFIDTKTGVLFDDRASWPTVNDPENSIILSNLYKTYKGYFTNEYWRAEFPELYAQFNDIDKSTLGLALNCQKTHNIYVNVDGDSIASSFKNLVNEDNYETRENPKFVDAANGNYLLEEDSPVFKAIDFKQIPTSRIGRYSERAINRIVNSVVFRNDSPYAYAGGKKVLIDENDNSVSPIELNGSVYIPLRFVSENMNAEVKWDETTNTAEIITKEGKSIKFTLDSDKATVEGVDVILEKVPVLFAGKTYIPIRAFSENVGYKVFWDDCGLICVSTDDRLDSSSDREIISYLSDELNIY